MRPSQKQITPEQLAFAQAHALVRIVDDEADLREALSFVLDMEGWKTVTYGRAEDFFTGDSPSEPGCVVLDVRMPGMSGLELQQAMEERGIELPVIFLTGHGDIDMAVKTMKDGADDFLSKPVTPERLLDAIEKAVKNDNLPEDESKRAEAEIQKMTDRFVAEVDEVLKKKEAEVMEI